MAYVSGRSSSAGTWLSTRPTWVLSAVLVSLISGVGVAEYRYTQWTALQRWYLATYLRSALLTQLGWTTTGRYALFTVVDRRGSRFALDGDVEPAVRASGLMTDAWSLRLASGAAASGVRRLLLEPGRYEHQALQRFLQRWIYQNRTLGDLAWPPILCGLGVLALGLLVAIPQDVTRGRVRRHGRWLRGPERLSPKAFTQRLRADGVGFLQARRGWSLAPARVVRIPQAMESSHVLLLGDTGSGKSMLIRQLLLQIHQRGETAIVYDPAGEFTEQFYDPARGDVILNPLDARTPFWTPADELRLDAEALTLAQSLYPEKPQEHSFFSEAPQRIMSLILTRRADTAQIVELLTNADHLDRLVEGTPYAAMIDKAAGPQRAGVLASLNMVADAMQLLPTASATTSRWSATGWSTTRQGWLFFTSTPETRARLVPLTSLWLDLLVLRLMHQQRGTRQRAWFIIDELASLQRLPQLHTAMTEARKSNVPLVLGFQGRSQMAQRYGLHAEVMLSQPATKVFFRHSEADAAKWVSQMIGEVEIERLRQGRSGSDGWASPSRHSTNYGLERQVESLVLASEIEGLPNLCGYLKYGNLVTKMHVSPTILPIRHPSFVPRADAATAGTPSRHTGPPVVATPGHAVHPPATTRPVNPWT